MLQRMIEKAMALNKLDELVDTAARRCGYGSIYAELCRELDIRADVSGPGLDRIPRTGPLLIIANHPMGFPEGLALPALIDSIRPDMMSLSHEWFRRWPALVRRMFLVNPQSTKDERNQSSFRAAVRHLRGGGCLLVFPAGEVAHARMTERRMRERPWRSGLGLLIRLTGANVAPFGIPGNNGILYDLLSRVRPRLGAFRLGHELLAKRGMAICLRSGAILDGRKLSRLRRTEDITEECRLAVDEICGNTLPLSFATRISTAT